MEPSLEQCNGMFFSECPMEINTDFMVVGEIVSFEYKGGRLVQGLVLEVSAKTVLLKLLTDYIGANDEWYIGEEKLFNVKEIC